MPALGLKLRLNRISARILSVITTNLQLWSKMILSPYTGGARILDASTAGNNGDAYTGRAMSFDGVNDVITIGNTGQSIRTVVMWVYPSTTTQSFCQLTASGGVDLKITSGTLSGSGWTSPTYYVNGAAGSTGITANVWRMVAVTSATAVTASDVRLGLDNTTYYGGRLSNVIFYNVELSAAQIAELYAYPEKPIPTGVTAANVVGWWPLAESVGSLIAFDGSGNGNNGTISGASDSLSQNGAVPQWGFVGNNWPMFFDRSNDTITRNTGFTPPSNFTYSTWCIVNNELSDNALFYLTTSSVTGFALLTINAQPGSLRLRFSDEADEAESSNTNVIKVRKLQQVSITMNTSTKTVRFYVDGVFINESTFTTAFPWGTTLDSYTVGGGSGYFFGGIIFNSVLYNSILTDAEITAIYNGGLDFDYKTNSGNYASAANVLVWYKNTGNQASDWLDLSGNGNNGTVNGSPGRVLLPEGETTGKDIVGMTLTHPVNAEFYDTTDGYIQVADAASLDITSAITLEAWVKPEVVNVAQTIVGKNSAYALNITSGAKLQFQRWSGTTSGTVASSASLVAGGWRHIAATYNGTTTLLYINGVIDTTSTAISGAIDATSTAALIGALTSSTQQFTGYIDDVRIYSGVLTAAQILNNYKATKAAHS